MNISLEYYKAFYYVTEYGSITAAAEKLCISQPAVSQAIHQLEKEFGCMLFVRNRRGVTLTSEGNMLYKYVKKGYEILQQGENNLDKMIRLDSGEVRIGASDMTLRFFLLPFLEKFHETYPNIKVNVTNGPTPETIKYLMDGKIDFGIVTAPFDNRYKNVNDIKITKVRKINDIFVAGNDFRYLKDKIIKFSELPNLPLICLEKNTSTRRFMDQFLSENNVTLEPEFELATSDMIVQFALRNLGIGCVVSDFAKSYLDSGELFQIIFEEEIPDREMCIINNEHIPLSIAGGKMLDIIAKK